MFARLAWGSFRFRRKVWLAARNVDRGNPKVVIRKTTESALYERMCNTSIISSHECQHSTRIKVM